MKKNIVLSLTVIFLVSCVFSGCSAQNIINDKDSGEIEVGEKEYAYYDGIYQTYSSYYGADGYFRAMKLKVEDGKICEINYDLLNDNGECFSEVESDEAEIFKSEIKSMNSKTMQNQTADGLFDNSEYSEDYRLLLEICLKNAEENNTQPSPIDVSFTYNESLVDINGNEAHLTVSYLGSKISLINYYVTSSGGLKLDDYIEGEKYFSDTMSYKAIIDYLTKIPDEGENLKKEDPSDRSLSVVTDYNILCGIIEEKHRRVDDGNINQLFSSL